MNEYKDIYEQICFTNNWDFNDFNRIVTYIYINDLDAFKVLKILAEDYEYATYKVKPVQSGIQITSSSILDEIDYDYDFNNVRTKETQKMIDDIYNIKCEDYLKDYNIAINIIIKLIKRTVEKQLMWGLKLV